jgi:hypothetical protein
MKYLRKIFESRLPNYNGENLGQIIKTIREVTDFDEFVETIKELLIDLDQDDEGIIKAISGIGTYDDDLDEYEHNVRIEYSRKSKREYSINLDHYEYLVSEGKNPTSRDLSVLKTFLDGLEIATRVELKWGSDVIINSGQKTTVGKLKSFHFGILNLINRLKNESIKVDISFHWTLWSEDFFEFLTNISSDYDPEDLKKDIENENEDLIIEIGTSDAWMNSLSYEFTILFSKVLEGNPFLAQHSNDDIPKSIETDFLNFTKNSG